MFPLQRDHCGGCMWWLLVLPSGIIIIDEMTPRAGQRRLYRVLAIASGEAKRMHTEDSYAIRPKLDFNEIDRFSRCLGDIDEY